MLKNKNLLIIAQSYANFIKDQTEVLSKNFNHVYVLVRYNPISELSTYISIFNYSNFTKNRLLDLSNKPYNITVIVTPILYLPIDSFYKKLGEFHYYSVKEAIKKYNIKFDLIHSHFIWSSGFVGIKLKQEYNVPLVITGHGYDVYSLPFKNEYWKNQVTNILKNADHIITVSKKNYECLLKLNIKKPIKIVPNGFRDDLFYPIDQNICKKLLNIPKNKKIILSIGSLEPVKGHINLIYAMEKITKERTDVLCIIIGDGKLKNKLQEKINDLHLNSFIQLVGQKLHQEIPIWINASDLFVLPSLNEGNPTVMFECLGCGKPVIGTRVGGIPEIINSKYYGRLISPNNIQEIYEVIIKSLNVKWNYNLIVDYGKQFTWEKNNIKIKEVYDTFNL